MDGKSTTVRGRSIDTVVDTVDTVVRVMSETVLGLDRSWMRRTNNFGEGECIDRLGIVHIGISRRLLSLLLLLLLLLIL